MLKGESPACRWADAAGQLLGQEIHIDQTTETSFHCSYGLVMGLLC